MLKVSNEQIYGNGHTFTHTHTHKHLLSNTLTQMLSSVLHILPLWDTMDNKGALRELKKRILFIQMKTSKVTAILFGLLTQPSLEEKLVTSLRK